MIDILAVLIALGLLMYLAFRGVTLLISAPGMALLAALIFLTTLFGAFYHLMARLAPR